MPLDEDLPPHDFGDQAIRDRQWRDWEQLKSPRPPLRLRPVLPLALYTATRPWGSNRTLIDLLGEPTVFHTFAPAWQPLFWNLADRTPEALLASDNAWLQALAVLRAAESSGESRGPSRGRVAGYSTSPAPNAGESVQCRARVRDSGN